MTKIKNILFDMARVLVEVDFSSFMAIPALEGMTSDEVFDRIDQTNAMERVERGEISFAKFFHEARKILSLGDMTLEEFETAWKTTIPHEISGMRGVIRELKEEGFRLAVFSNLDPVLEAKALHEFKILAEFERVFVSHKIKRIKPDLEAFRYVLSEWGVKPEETLFVDDRRYHVRGAMAVGCEGYVFHGVQDFCDYLTDSGILK